MKKVLLKVKNMFVKKIEKKSECELLAIGSLLSKQIKLSNSKKIIDHEFKIFSQWGDDGIIQYLIQNIEIENKCFIEFGVEDYLESNTRFLMMNDNWEGFVMDGSTDAINSLKSQNWFWKFCLTAKSIFINKENINFLLSETGYKNIGLLHIDLDGNDYHIFNALDLSVLNPNIIITEYNSVFGKSRAITVPYDENFYRTNKHFSNLYWGASLPALNKLANQRGYALVYCNLAGNNAYFVRRDLLNSNVFEISVEEAFKESKYRESRDPQGNLTYLKNNERYLQIKGMEVLNVDTGEFENL